MAEYLFALVDDYVSSEMSVKILCLLESVHNGEYKHVITPHLNILHHGGLNMRESISSNMNLQKMNVGNETLYLWRTGFTVEYGGAYIPILDTDKRYMIPGDYDYKIGSGMLNAIDYLSHQSQIRRSVMNIIGVQTPRPSPPTSPSKIPSFVTNALKRDAIQANYTCPITLEEIKDINVSITSCFHLFSTSGISQSLKTNSNCPVCREKVQFVQNV